MKKPKASIVRDEHVTPVLKVPSRAQKSTPRVRKSTRLKKPSVKALPQKTKRTSSPVSKKPHPTDVLGKTITITGDSGLEKKMQIVTRISNRKTTTVPSYVKVGTPSLAEFKTKIHLALMVPFRTPREYSALASGVARYAGVAFVVVGGFFTLLGMQAWTLSSHNQEAQVMATCTTATHCTDLTSETRTPSADIRLQSGRTTLTGKEEVFVTVSGATRVDLVLHSSVSGKDYTLASLEKIQDTVWKTLMNTQRYDDGVYTLHALVTHVNGVDEAGVSSAFTIDNSTHTTSTTPTTTDGTTTPEVGDTESRGIDTPEEDHTETEKVPEEIAETDSPKTVVPSLVPSMKLTSTYRTTDAGTVDVVLTVPDARFVEFYLMKKQSLTPQFLGLGIKTAPDTWSYTIDTQSIPSGSYELYAHVRHLYGDSESERQDLVVNHPLVTTLDENILSDHEKIETLVSDIAKLRVDIDGTTSTSSIHEQSGSSLEPHSDLPEDAEAVYLVYRDILNAFLKNYAVALRAQDHMQVQELLAQLERDRDMLLEPLRTGEQSDSLAQLKDEIQSFTNREREFVEKSEHMIRERLGSNVTQDTDRDGVGDFDELNLYQTNPTRADTDDDGVIDGVEVAGGFDPLSSGTSALRVYESPKDAGTLRADILSVSSVTTLSTEEAHDIVYPRAHIAGKALPFSFVTLYIFSTPIMVTVKADASGAWSYVFDKELEDGTHEVIVAMTDNTGRIVAKSAPFAFTKTAEAFSPVRDVPEVTGPTLPPPTLITPDSALTIGALAIVSLGLLLLLLGFYVREKQSVRAPSTV